MTLRNSVVPVTASTLTGMTLNQVAFGNSTGGLQGSANLTFNGSTLALTGAQSISGQLTSTVATGTPPFVVASSSNVPNLNASLLTGNSWASPAAIGTGTPADGTFTNVTVSAFGGNLTFSGTGTSNGNIVKSGTAGSLIVSGDSASAGARLQLFGSTHATLASRGYFVSASTSLGYFDATSLNILPTTASSSTTTGALVVTGGLGVGGAINAGGLLNITNSLGTPVQVTSSNGFPELNIQSTATGAANNYCGYRMNLKNGSAAQIDFGYFNCKASVVTAGSEESQWTIGGRKAGTMTDWLRAKSARWVFGENPTDDGVTRMQIDGGLSINSATLIKTNTSFTNGAAANTGTLTNAPAAGNPTKWIPINDNGTTRYIPAW